MSTSWPSPASAATPVFTRASFCPSCHQKRVVEFGEWLCTYVLKKIPHRHFVFSIPKILRRYFLGACPRPDRGTNGCFYGRGMFRVSPPPELKKLETIFQHEVFRMLLTKGKVTRETIAILLNWRHSGFHVFCGNRIWPKDETATENLARYIIRALFSQERMQYLDQESKIVYSAKDGKDKKVFDALEWLAAMCTHVPDKGERPVILRYYGYYSNVSRGKRQEEGNEPQENLRNAHTETERRNPLHFVAKLS